MLSIGFVASLGSHVARTVFAAGLVACASIADLDQPYELARGGGGGGPGGAGGAAPACPPAALPPVDPPRPTQVPPGADTEFFVAIDTVDFGENTDANAPCGERPLPGLNIDLRASTSTDLACQPAPNPDDREQYLCDGAGGVDNQNANLSSAFGASTRLGSVDATTAAKSGHWSIVVRVSGYNGGLEDDAVTVALYSSTGTASPPRWDGTDDLPIDRTSVTGGLDAPIYATTSAYVTCGMLVATIGDFPIDMMNPPTHLRLSLTGVRLIAKILRDDIQRFELEGVMGGVWSLDQAFIDLESARVLDGSAVCADPADPTYEVIQELLCLLPDTTDGPASITTPCNAVSAGVAFHASPVARPTNLVAPQAYPPECEEMARPINNKCN